MIDKHMRHAKEYVLTPLAARLQQIASPTSITLVAAGIGCVAALAAWQQWYILGLVLWLLNRILDGLDGTIARMYNKQSDLGGYLDIVLDTVIYALVPLALASGVNTIAGYVSVGMLLGSFYINSASWIFLAALLEKRKHGAAAQGELTTITMASGLIEGTETIVFYCLLFLFPSAMNILFITMAVLVLATVAQRLIWAVRNL